MYSICFQCLVCTMNFNGWLGTGLRGRGSPVHPPLSNERLPRRKWESRVLSIMRGSVKCLTFYVCLCMPVCVWVVCESVRQGGTAPGASVTVHLAFRRLGEPVVLFHHHVLSEFLQHHPDVVGVFPPGQRCHRLYVHLKGEKKEMKEEGGWHFFF